jgi:hypothetical protein
MRYLVAAFCCLVAVSPEARAAGACDIYLRETVRATGVYLPVEETYARPFVFALRLDCNGTRELVTVQRPTGRLPVCAREQPVEVQGKLIWNRSLLVPGHYEINDPASVTCR